MKQNQKESFEERLKRTNKEAITEITRPIRVQKKGAYGWYISVLRAALGETG